jgi:hypothetical protein
VSATPNATLATPGHAEATRARPCALCAGPAASPLGLCLGCLLTAAAELARLTARQPSAADASPASVPYRSLCGRCGSYRHETSACDA